MVDFWDTRNLIVPHIGKSLIVPLLRERREDKGKLKYLRNSNYTKYTYVLS